MYDDEDEDGQFVAPPPQKNSPPFVPPPPNGGPQTRAERERIMANLPEGVRRVKTLQGGVEKYKVPADVDLDLDEIPLTSSGAPVVMRGFPGRKPRIHIAAVTPDAERNHEAKTDHIDEDKLVGFAEDPESPKVLSSALAGLAKDAAALEFERLLAEKRGDHAEAIRCSMIRSRVMKNIIDTSLRLKTISAGGVIDLDSATFSVLFGMILQTFKEAMNASGVRAELVETTFSHLVKALDDPSWKEDAKKKMKDKVL